MINLNIKTSIPSMSIIHPVCHCRFVASPLAPGEFQAKNFQEDEVVTQKLKGGNTMKVQPH